MLVSIHALVTMQQISGQRAQAWMACKRHKMCWLCLLMYKRVQVGLLASLSFLFLLFPSSPFPSLLCLAAEEKNSITPFVLSFAGDEVEQ